MKEREANFTTRRGQIRWLADELGIPPLQANRLIRAYLLDQRDRDAHMAAREEFKAWIHRRGDLVVVRGKRQHDWRLTSE